MSNTNIKTLSNDINFTKDQKIAVEGILNFIKKPYDEKTTSVALIGAGGVGKTFITKYIIDNCSYGRNSIKCSAPTHKACRVFANAVGMSKVDTVQKTFGLRLDLNLEDFDPDNPQFDPKGEVLLEGISLLIIDEASMIPFKLSKFIDKVCKSKGVKVIYIGDNSQLAPVNESRSSAFTNCFKVFTLTTIVRQKAENPMSKLLDMLRRDIRYKSNDFLHYIYSNQNSETINEFGEGFKICSDKEFMDAIQFYFSKQEYLTDINKYRIISYTNLAVSKWNMFVRSKIIPNYDKEVITRNDLLMSYTSIVDDFLSTIFYNSEEYIVHDIVNYKDPRYDIKGYLVKFQKVYGGDITKPMFIIDHRDTYSIRIFYKILNDLKESAKKATSGTRVAKWKMYFDFRAKYMIITNVLDKNGRTVIDRSLDYGFAISAHKSQGSTYDIVFVDVKDIIYDKNGNLYGDKEDMLRRLYVACSRARSKIYLRL